MSFDPISEKDVGRLEGVRLALSELTEKDRIRDLISQGENESVEFKASFSLDRRTGKKLPELEKACLKTIVGFMNAKGGELFIGVEDNKNTVGIDDEIEKFDKSQDRFDLRLTEKISGAIGKALSTFVEHKVLELDKKSVVIVKVKKSNKPVFLFEKEFYLRKKPQTVILEGKDLLEYTQRRFQPDN